MTVAAFLQWGERTFDALAYATLRIALFGVGVVVVAVLLAALVLLAVVQGVVLLGAFALVLADMAAGIVRETWSLARRHGWRWLLSDMLAAWRGEPQRRVRR